MVAFGSARIANLPSTTISTSNEQKLPASKMIVSSAGAGGPCCAPAYTGAHAAARPSTASAIGNRRAVLMTVVTNIKAVTPSAGWRTHPIADAPTASKPYPEYMPPDDADHPSAGSSVVPSLTKPRGSKFRSASAVLRPTWIEARAPGCDFRSPKTAKQADHATHSVRWRPVSWCRRPRAFPGSCWSVSGCCGQR